MLMTQSKDCEKCESDLALKEVARKKGQKVRIRKERAIRKQPTIE